MMPLSASPWINLSAALLSLGEGKAARAAARRAVALDPNFAPGWHALGVTQRAQGNYPEALQAFESALALDRSRAELWLDAGLVCYQQGDLLAAQHAVAEALSINSSHPGAQVSLAMFMFLAGRQQDAIDAFRRLLRDNPDYVAARLNLANALLLDEKPAEALDLLRGPPPPGRDGQHWRAYRATALLVSGRRTAALAELDAIPEPLGDVEILVLMRRIALLDADDERAEALADRVAQLAGDESAALLEHRIVACFDLARFKDRKGQHEAAFAHLARGHQMLARSQPFSRDGYRDFVDTSIACFSASRMLQGPRSAEVDPGPLFIVGLPRSGTTLTEQIVASHPDVFGAGERPAIHRLLQSLAGPPDEADSVRRLAALDAAELTNIGVAYLAELRALAPNHRIITDKMPNNARHLGVIATMLPGARIIHCTRDPRDTGLSIYQHRFFGYHPYAHDLADIGWLIGEHHRLMAHWRASLPLPMIEVALTDWVYDFQGTLARVIAFLGLPYDAACERFFETPRTIRTASASQVRQPINARGIGRWRDYRRQLEPMLAELERVGLIADGMA
jgi:tetratricopeptide (TPR) repeat protein